MTNGTTLSKNLLLCLQTKQESTRVMKTSSACWTLALQSLKLMIPDPKYSKTRQYLILENIITNTRRTIERDRRLDAVLDAIDAAITDNDPQKANDIRLRLLTDFPELAANGQMARRINATSR